MTASIISEWGTRYLINVLIFPLVTDDFLKYEQIPAFITNSDIGKNINTQCMIYVIKQVDLQTM